MLGSDCWCQFLPRSVYSESDTGRAAAEGCGDVPRARGTSFTEFRSAANICTKPARACMLGEESGDGGATTVKFCCRPAAPLSH